jgi:hypothetical protein
MRLDPDGRREGEAADTTQRRYSALVCQAASPVKRLAM